MEGAAVGINSMMNEPKADAWWNVNERWMDGWMDGWTRHALLVRRFDAVFFDRLNDWRKLRVAWCLVSFLCHEIDRSVGWLVGWLVKTKSCVICCLFLGLILL